MDIGVIEGFYGRSWTNYERLQMIQFLSDWSFDAYWYAPKSCNKLRNDWQAQFTDVEMRDLQQLSAACSASNIHFGVGLSLIGLHECWPMGASVKDALRVKLQQLADLNLSQLGLLFDDMRGDVPDLASKQVEMVHWVAEFLGRSCDLQRLIFCPTYYSFDPVLVKVFGEKPAGYLTKLGESLDPSIDIFWTGKRVVSSNCDDYSPQHLQKISDTLHRKPVIWDNSRVSDGRLTSPFLPLKSMMPPSLMEGHVNGIMVNPMNPPALAQINLQTLKLSGSDEDRLKQAMNNQGEGLSECLIQNLDAFNRIGRDDLSADELGGIYRSFSAFKHPVAMDVLRWLDGEYRFDPACLT